jgi:hypothetical protein
MNELAGGARVPLSFWVVTGLGLLWNGFACMVYWLTATKDPGTMAQTSPTMLAAINNTPSWVMAAWGVAVGAALAGSFLLVLRRRWAVSAFAASLGGLLVLAYYQIVANLPMSLFQVVMIWLVVLFLLRFSSSEAGKGLLR